MTTVAAVRQIERAVDEKLRGLDLSGLKLEEVPPEIAKCTHLVKLNLHNTQITSIPEVLGQLSNLEVLILSVIQYGSVKAEIVVN